MENYFQSTIEEQTESYARIVIEPLDQGYGHTVGNALRRTLLTSVKGAAVTQAKIAGIKHMFTTLSGMKEDIVEFILQLKELQVKYAGEDPIELHLDATGPKEITAKDIELPSGVEIVNPDLVLGHLADKKSTLSATLTVETGYGYVAAEERKMATVGLIPLDASFSPVKRVRFDVRETRVGRRTDFDKLVLEIWTDATVDPTEALKQASQKLVDHFIQIVNPVIPETKAEETQSIEELEIMKLTVEELDLPTRIANALRKGGYKTVKDLTMAKKDAIAKVKNLGGKSVEVVEEKLKAKGVGFLVEQ